MLNCFPENIIFQDEELLKAIKEFPKTELSDAEQIISKCKDDVLDTNC